MEGVPKGTVPYTVWEQKQQSLALVGEGVCGGVFFLDMCTITKSSRPGSAGQGLSTHSSAVEWSLKKGRQIIDLRRDDILYLSPIRSTTATILLILNYYKLLKTKQKDIMVLKTKGEWLNNFRVFFSENIKLMVYPIILFKKITKILIYIRKYIE